MTAPTYTFPALAGLALLLFAAPNAGQCGPDLLAPSSGLGNDHFGESVAIDGTRAVVGAPFEGAAGAAYVYDWNGSNWVESVRLTPGGTGSPKHFGAAVAVSGDRIAIGAPLSGSGSGSTWYQNAGLVYVFEKSGGVWSQVAELEESTRDAWQYVCCGELGRSVDIQGDTIVVGQPGYGWFGFASGFGSVNVYQAPYAGVMTEFAHLDRQDLAASAVSGNRLGQSVGISGGTIAAGAPDNAADPSQVFVFELVIGDWSTGVINNAVLTNSDPTTTGVGDEFGDQLAVSGNTIVVGAPRQKVSGVAESGKVYIFEKAGAIWVDATETSSLDVGGTATRFGTGVAVDGTAGTLLVGDPLANGQLGIGHVYQKVAGIWVPAWSLNPPVGGFPNLGTAAAISGDRKLFGASNSFASGSPDGRAWVWDTPLALGTATARNGLGGNPASFVSVTLPTVGASWQTTIDIVTPGALASIVAVALGGPTSGFVLSGLVSGELLVLPPLPTDLMDFSTGAHSIAVPPDCNLIGVALSAQAATFFPGDIRLQNALDLVFGSF